MNGGGIGWDLKGTPIDDNRISVSKGNVLSVLPFGNTVAVVSLNVSQIKEMLEHSLTTYTHRK